MTKLAKPDFARLYLHNQRKNSVFRYIDENKTAITRVTSGLYVS